LGWSLGGHIALAIASILEFRGVTNIKVYLLDTIALNKGSYLQPYTEKELNHLIEDSSYIFQQIENYEVKARSVLLTEWQLANQPISSTLIYTKVLLFKALFRSGADDLEIDEAAYSSIQLDDNNISQLLNKTDQIKIINMKNTYHENILDEEDTIVSGINEYLNW
jgi:thioesterase domain-containing protein